MDFINNFNFIDSIMESNYLLIKDIIDKIVGFIINSRFSLNYFRKIVIANVTNFNIIFQKKNWILVGINVIVVVMGINFIVVIMGIGFIVVIVGINVIVVFMGINFIVVIMGIRFIVVIMGISSIGFTMGIGFIVVVMGVNFINKIDSYVFEFFIFLLENLNFIHLRCYDRFH